MHGLPNLKNCLSCLLLAKLNFITPQAPLKCQNVYPHINVYVFKRSSPVCLCSICYTYPLYVTLPQSCSTAPCLVIISVLKADVRCTPKLYSMTGHDSSL